MHLRRALLSVSDKTGLIPLAQGLHGAGFVLVSTGGTASALREAGLAVTDVSEITGFPEMMDGRVKTLHPAVHGGLLARRDRPAHLDDARQHGIGLLDVLVVNLYPFESTLGQTADIDALIANIDIGGPAMIRSAAKNHASVTVLVDPADYDAVLAEITAEGDTRPTTRRRLAAKAFSRTSAYDTLIGAWLSGIATREATPAACASVDARAAAFPAYLLDAVQHQPLRYGENPHQAAALYRRMEGQGGIAQATVIQGKTLSFNNLADAETAFALATRLADAGAVPR